MKITNLEIDKRPRERLSLYGVKTLNNTELIAIILGKGTKDLNAIELAQNILKKHRLRDFNNISAKELMQSRGIGYSKSCAIIAAVELGKRCQRFNPLAIKKISTPKDAFNVLKDDLSQETQEKTICLFLNSRDMLIEKKTIFIGTIDKQLVSPRDIAKEALQVGATKVILAHNHPSEELSPSSHDQKATERIKAALNHFDIDLIDHLIISGNNFFSFKEKGIME
jgi:DNA repair protein RadC